MNERAVVELMYNPDGPGAIATAEYKDYYISSGHQPSDVDALKCVCQIALEYWVDEVIRPPHEEDAL